MLRSRSRSGPSALTRSFSARILCRGDAIGSQIDLNAVKSKSSSNMSQNDKLSPVRKLEEELKSTKQKLSIAESESKQVLDELRSAKEKAYLANLRADQSSSLNKDSVLTKEIENLKLWLSDTRDELKTKDRKIASLEEQLEKKEREFEVLIAEKDKDLNQIKVEVRDFKDKEQDMSVLISDGCKRIQELETELKLTKESASKMFKLFVTQCGELDAKIFELEECKTEAHLLLNTIKSLQESVNTSGLASELQRTKDDLTRAQENEKRGLEKVEGLHLEIKLLKGELNASVENERRSSKRSEELTWALNEVSGESNQAKKNLSVASAELDQVKGEAKRLKTVILSSDEKYKKLLQEANQKAEYYKNMADRLRLEAEDTFLAWNGKEMGFVSCIRRAEEEREVAQCEKERLAESLQLTEVKLKMAREETDKLRDLLREAVIEANGAKAGAEIAGDEVSRLKECLKAKDEELNTLITRCNEGVRINEASVLKAENCIKRSLNLSIEDLKFVIEPEDYSNEKLLLEDDKHNKGLHDNAEIY